MGGGCLLCWGMIYSVACEGTQFRVNNIKHGCVNLRVWRGCNGGGPPFSNRWAELKRCSLSIITDHIRLFMAAAHPSAPSSRIMSHQKAWIISDWLPHDTEHIVLQTPPQSSSLSAIEQLRSFTPQNFALKWNHQPFSSVFFLICSENFGEQIWTGLVQHLREVCAH